MLDHSAGGRIGGARQRKDRAGKQDRLHRGGTQRIESVRGGSFKMVRGARAQFGGQSGSRAGAELLGVHAQLHAMGARGGEHLARFFDREGVVVAESVAKARQLEVCNLGD